MTEERKRYFITRPTANRKTFVLVCYVALPEKKRQYIPISGPLQKQMDSINGRFLAHKLNRVEAETLIKELIQAQYRKHLTAWISRGN